MASKSNGAAAGLRLPGIRTKGDLIAGRYRVEAVLGRGSSGFVVAARHPHTREQVRLKILTYATRSGQKVQRQYLAKAHLAATLESPHAARILDTGFTDDGDAFIATDFLGGRSLADELRARKQLPVAEAVRWIVQACDAIGEAHAKGFVHGDLKPQNVFLVGQGETRIAKVVDFGMNAPVDEKSPAFFSSPAYLAPELITDPENAGARADVWALGVMLHQLVTGALPFAGSTIAAMLVAVASGEPAPLPDAPEGLAELVAKCLAKDPRQRFTDARALAQRLAPFAKDRSASEPPLTMTMDRTESQVLKTAPFPLVMHTEAAAAAARVPSSSEIVAKAAPEAIPGVVAFPPPPRVPAIDDEEPEGLAFGRRSAAMDRRRRGAMLTACAAGVLALVGFALPANDDHPRAAKDTEPPPITPPGEEIAVVPHDALPPVFVPPSYTLPAIPSSVPPQLLGERAEMDLKAPISVPIPPSSSSQLAPTSTKHPTLAVRDDPYTSGFTHPTRLGDARK